MTKSDELFLTLAITVVGSGLGTTIVGVLFKQQFDSQLETYKALLQRNSRIHERQVDALLSIHAKLEQGLFYLQRATSAGKLAGEPDDRELLRRVGEELASASEVFSNSRLLIGQELARKLGNFFDQTVEASRSLNLAESPTTPDGQIRADFFDKARDIAFRELPSLLEAIRTESKTIIHG